LLEQTVKTQFFDVISRAPYGRETSGIHRGYAYMRSIRSPSRPGALLTQPANALYGCVSLYSARIIGL